MNSDKTLLLLIAMLSIIGSSILYFRQRPIQSQENVLHVGTAAEFPPFEYIENDLIIGFDIDLIQQIALRIGKKIQIDDMPFSTLIQQLQLGNIDVIAAGLTPTEERKKQLLFSEHYIEGSPLVIVSPVKQKINSLNELANKAVIVNDGFSSDAYLSNYSTIDIKRLPTIADAFMAIKAGKAAAFITARNTITPFLTTQEADDFFVIDIPNTNEPAAFALSKKRPDLEAEINKALDSMKEDGSLMALKKKWDLNS